MLPWRRCSRVADVLVSLAEGPSGRADLARRRALTLQAGSHKGGTGTRSGPLLAIAAGQAAHTKGIAGSLTPSSGAVTLAVVRDNDGRKLDHQTLEILRLRAVEQVEAGVPAAEVGRGLAALGLHPKTIYTWLSKERAEGRGALRAKPVPGRARKLTDAQLGELTALITDTDPRDHGFAVALWTREIVRQLIGARFGVALTVASVGRTLHDLGFSAQRPLYRAEQADPAAVARWTEVEYPQIAAAAK